MFLQLLYTILMFSLFTATSNHLLNKRISRRHPNHSLREIIAGINYAHHDTREKITAYKQLQRRNLAPKIRTNGSLSEYKTLEKLFVDVDNSWSHSDQGRWPEKYPSCGGNYQSPIELHRRFAPRAYFPPLVFTSHNLWHPNLRLYTSPHSVDAYADWYDIPTISGGPLTREYNLVGLHWHWGTDRSTGTEHYLEIEAFDLEMHAVHYDSRYRSIDEAMNSLDSEAIVVLAMVFRLSTESNPGMANIVYILENGRSFSDYLNLSVFNIESDRYYFTYKGSLTTPPCHQVVRWIVFERAESITQSELNIMRNLSHDGKQIGPNYRQLQGINGRIMNHEIS